MRRITLLIILFFTLQLGNAQCTFSQSSLITDVTCFGGNDGSITISVVGGVGPFEYTIDGGPLLTVGSFPGLTAGSHTVEVIDNGDSFCTTSNIYVVNQPTAISVLNSSTPVTCFGACDGNIILIPMGGTSPHTVSWSTGATTMSIGSLCSAVYNYTVVDNVGCSALGSVIVTSPTALSITPIVTNATCGGFCDGSISILTSGGTAPYSYSWQMSIDGGTSWLAMGLSAPIATSLCPAMYSFTAIDINGCIITDTVIITAAGAGAMTLTTTVTPSLCDSCNGTITFHSSGGTGSHIYAIDGGATFYADSVFINLCPFMYNLVAQDSLGCQVSVIESVTTNITGLAVSESITNELAAGLYDGSISLSITGATSPLTFLWSNGATTQNISSLTAGTYTVTIEDTTGYCTVLSYIVIVTPAYGSVVGNIFVDMNANCINDPGDINLSSKCLNTSPSSFVTCTNLAGYYNYYLPNGTYTLIPDLPTYYSVSTGCSVSGIATVTSGSSTTINFPITATGTICDGSLYLHNIGIVPGFTGMNTVNVSNIGTNIINGILTATIPQFTSYTSSSVSPTSVSGDTLTFDIINLLPGTVATITIGFYCPPGTTLGLVSLSYAELTLTGCTDINTTNNTSIFARIISGSFDPNDKSVSPVGDVTLDEEYFTYLIRFQNTGNGPAVNITVKDTLSTLLDYSQIELLSSSHPYFFSLIDNSVMLFHFDSIMLPDSAANEPGSHGWILFKIKRNAGLVIGDIIENTADIYFDFNEPVITNTTQNEFVLPGGFENLSMENDLMMLYPNPVNDILYIQFTKASKGKINVCDVNGKIVNEIMVNNQSVQLPVNHLEKGVYFIRFVGVNETSALKFIRN